MYDDNENHANKQANSLLWRMNQRMLIGEYERAHDLISRMTVWFTLPPDLQEETHDEMKAMFRDFMRTSHDPYEDNG